jgi:phospholipase/carboxylesterase
MSLETTLTTFEDWTLRVYVPPQKSGRVVLMLHGWTGDENSMWTFARSLPPEYWMIAPRAPHALSQGGYSWRLSAVATASNKRAWPTLADMRPSLAMLADLIERWGIANNVDTSQVDMLGFSQGGAMAMAFAMLYPQRVRRVGVLAGFALQGLDAHAPARPLEGKPVFISHGTLDDMVPIDLARYSVRLLEDAGAQITYCEAEVGHKVSADCRRALESFFSKE